eukprot:TRINITY_DN7513_c1_g1_i2.p1 TRINITY_DN7513_c1_g1~~TRINITY_DN7513_c1_g1_i2.p1  ORF type:complete len:230 (+),score=41.21 TRINITY_DN7513_c1_g1_i2:30-692(+)
MMLENRTHWVPDSDAKNCGACEAEFTLWKRRHHCRSCGRVFCNACSSEKRELAHLGYEGEVRCCMACAKIEDSRADDFGTHNYYDSITTPEEETRSPNSSTSYNRDCASDSTNDVSSNLEDDSDSQSDCEEAARSTSVPISFSQSVDNDTNTHYSHRMSNRRSRRMQITQAECGVTVWSVSLSSRTPKKECSSYSKYPQRPASNSSDNASSSKRVTFSVP